MNRYSKIAILLHWLIALMIITQIAAGLWMVDAIKVKDTQKIAFDVFQWHKALGLTVLVLSLLRLFWRLINKPPALPNTMKKSEVILSKMAHWVFYFLMISIPLLGWVMVSVSSYGLPTMWFGLFEWPHLWFLTDIENKKELSEFASESHELLAKLTILLLVMHIAAALKHHFIKRDNVLSRMLPIIKPRS